MHLHTAHIIWQRGTQPFIDKQYSRRHTIAFDGGIFVPGSSSPAVVPLPLSDPAAIDPEEAFIAALSSCHMLWFLSIAAARQFCVDSYSDHAEGVLSHNTHGKLVISIVTLRPQVVFSGVRTPGQQEFLGMHREAHEDCFLANSVLTEVKCEPKLETV
ncbi:MAG: OsmC family protein [Planctomycetota bacterium]